MPATAKEDLPVQMTLGIDVACRAAHQASLERDAVGLEMLCYLRHHPAPHLAGEPIISRIRPPDPWQLPARSGGRGRIIAGRLRPFTTRHHTTPRRRAQTRCHLAQAPAGPRVFRLRTASRRGDIAEDDEICVHNR
jgi:hypothetical protein